MRISDWSSDVCSSDLASASGFLGCASAIAGSLWRARQKRNVTTYGSSRWAKRWEIARVGLFRNAGVFLGRHGSEYLRHDGPEHVMAFAPTRSGKGVGLRSEEHTSELQSLMRISYAVFSLQKTKH